MSLSVYPANPPLYGSRNVIRNGDMGVSQRGVGAFTADGFTADGWSKSLTGGGTHTVNIYQSPVGTGLGVNNGTYHLSSGVSGQSAVGDYSFLYQRIEGVRTLAGKAVTLSFLAYAGAGTPSIGIEVSQSFGSGGSAVVQTAIQAVQITTTATRYTVSFTVPSIVGKTMGSDPGYLQLNLWQSAGSTFAARASSIGIGNGTLYITDIQLEQGSATDFERLPYQMQLAWCQRYFERFTSDAGELVMVGNTTNSYAYNPLKFAVKKRAVPILIHNVAAGDQVFFLYVGGTQTPNPGFSTNGATIDHARILLASGTYVNGGWYVINTPGRYLDCSAEL